MTVVSGKSRVNRPFFFTDTAGDRVEIPAFDRGQGDLEGGQLAEFRMYERVGQIEASGVQYAPVNTVAPAVTGTAQVGSTLTATNGTWTGTPAPTYTRAWQRSSDGVAGWVAIGGATATTYVLDAADDGQYVRCVVTGTNSAGNSAGNSNVSGPVIPAE